jgi:hypothetical protein
MQTVIHECLQWLCFNPKLETVLISINLGLDNKLRYRHTIKYYLAIKNKLLMY